MKLTVLSVAYPLAPVSFDAAGGAEQVLAMLDAALERRDHRSLVVAPEGSAVQGVLMPTAAARGELDEQARKRAWRKHREAIACALSRWPVDLVHMHGVDFYRYLPAPGPAVLATLHLPLAWYPPKALDPSRPHTYLHCVSESQHRTRPERSSMLAPIANGVPIERLTGNTRKREFALALGRICPEKGFHLAIDAARRAGVPLRIAGPVFGYPVHLKYYRKRIAPRLDGRRIRFLGPVGFEGKRRLLAAARCLLAPSLVSETSSLAAMEAIASGTPVIAFPAGALAEIVEDGRTGFLVRDAAEMAEAIRAVGSIKSEECRRAARERFDSRRTIESYLTLYERLAAARAG